MSGKDNYLGLTPYPDSVHEAAGCTVFMTKTESGEKLAILGANPGFIGEEVIKEQGHLLLADLSHENAQVLRRVFPFTAPRQGLVGGCSIGVGDRLGIAAAGHLRVFKRYPLVFPVLAQQSIRELMLTERSYEEVLDCVSFAVFKEGFERGFGADGDHLKKPEEIEYALRCSYSMITLDSSEHIRGDVNTMSEEAVKAAYKADQALEKRYLGRGFDIGADEALHFSLDELMRASLIYGESIAFISDIYERYIRGGNIDFEISIDETATPTTPLEHFFVANELTRRGVRFASLAPRFCGEFQKGIDYIGDLDQFERELVVHDAIAKHFGYKLSVHSGSDKFSVFPVVGSVTGGVFHLKTAGTNWLEAVRLVAMKAPGLYRDIHLFALEKFKDATKYYHVTTNLNNIPNIAALSDAELPKLMDMNDARQLLHITYGLILTTKNEDGRSRFKDDLYALWDRYEEDYAALLDGHIGRHLELLFSQI